MLKKCKYALLLTDVTSFANTYRQVADEADVNLTVESEWAERFRVKQDVVILGTKYLDKLNEMYYERAVLILKAEESPFPYVQKGITRFIFDYQNQYELFLALFKEEPVFVSYASRDMEDMLKEYNTNSFRQGVYDFDFRADSYCYKGKPIYLTKAQKRYLADWLLSGHKDNSRRMIIHNLRKRFGNDFLREVNRFGEIKEEKDE